MQRICEAHSHLLTFILWPEADKIQVQAPLHRWTCTKNNWTYYSRQCWM